MLRHGDVFVQNYNFTAKILHIFTKLILYNRLEILYNNAVRDKPHIPMSTMLQSSKI